MENEEYYIKDEDLAVLLKDVLGDKITDDDIERILAASEDGEITEDDLKGIEADVQKVTDKFRLYEITSFDEYIYSMESYLKEISDMF